MNSLYEKIAEINPGEDVLKILKSWENFSKNKARFMTDAPVVLPDMLLVTKSGYGTTKLVTLLTEYLYTEGVMEFYGDVRFFEFKLGYSKEASFGPMSEFKDALLTAAGFRNEFKGVVCVDISEWTNHINDKHFIDFLEYLSENSDPWHIVFVTDCNDKEKLKKLEALLCVYFRIDIAEIMLPDTALLVEYMKKRLEQYGFELDCDAEAILAETVDHLRKSKYFDGYKSLNMICSDLVYKAFSASEFTGRIINKDIAAFYSKDSEFVKRTKQNIEKRNSIGFGVGGGKDE